LSHDVAARVRAIALGAGGLLAALVGRPGTSMAAPVEAGAGAEGLHWHAPAGCPDEATVQARLARVLPPEVAAPRVEADVHVTDDGRFHAAVVLRGSWGETTRQLDSPTCDTLADAVVLLTAVSASAAGAEQEQPIIAVPEPVPLAPSVAVEEVGSEPEPGVDVEGDAAAERPELPVGTDERSPGGSSDAAPSSPPAVPVLRGLARVEARAGAGLLPVVDLGGAATLGLEHRWFRIELTGTAWLPRERTVAPEARVRASAWALELRGCAALRPAARWVVLPCAELDAGQLRGEGRGEGLVSGPVSRQPWVAVGIGPALSLRLHRLVALWAGATLVVPVRRAGLGVEGLSTDAHRMAVVAGRGAVGVEIHFP